MSKQMIGWSCALVALGGWVVSERLAAQPQQNPFDNGAVRQVERVVQKSAALRSAEERINFTLNQKLKSPLDYDGEQLDIVLEAIADEYGLTIVFDKAALDEVAISPELEVTIKLRNVSLRSALKLMLREPGLEDLTFIIEDEVLLITTQETMCETLRVLVYQVSDLLDASPRRYNSADLTSNYDQLIDVIVACVAVDTWSENGGAEGEIQAFSPGLLVITQTSHVHGQVQDLLTKLRQAKQQMIVSDSAASAKAKPITQGFAIELKPGDNPEKVQKQLAVAIKKSVDWVAIEGAVAENQTWLEVLPDRVLVRHVPKVIEQVAIVLSDMHVLDPAKMQTWQSNGRGIRSTGSGGGGFGGGGGGYF